MESDLFQLTFTVPGVLTAGKWRTPDQLANMDAAAQHNALAEAMAQNSSETKETFQALNDHDLVGRAAVVVFLMEAGIRGKDWLTKNIPENHRNTLIVEVAGRTGRGGNETWGYDNQRLVKIASQWFGTTKLKPGSPEESVFGDPDCQTVDRMILGYFQMMFESARAHYLADRRKEAAERMGWIARTFPYGPSPTPSEEYTYLVEPFATSISASQKNLREGLDYYGYTSEHVPLMSMAFYEGRLNTFLTTAEKIQEKFEKYEGELQRGEEQLSDYEAAFNENRDFLAAVSKELESVRGLIAIASAHIKDADVAASNANGAFIKKVREFKEAIRSEFNLPGPEEMASVLLNLSFMPEKSAAQAAMVASQAVTVGSDTMRSLSSVTMDDGTQVDKAYVINRLDVVGSDIADFNAAYSVLSSNFIKKDDGVYRLVQDSARFRDLCANFYNKTGKATEAKAALEEYMRKVGYRNAKIDEYNALWGRWMELTSQLAKIKSDGRKTELNLARSQDPALPYRVTAITNLHNRSRDLGLKFLDQMGRAYAFWGLSPYDQLAEVCKLSDPDAIDCDTLRFARDKILEAQADQMGDVMARLRKGAIPDEGADLKLATGILVPLTRESHATFMDDLVKKGRGSFELTPDNPKLADKANIRLRRVRAWIYGIQPENKLHEVRMTHTGPEKIVGFDGKSVSFFHDPVFKDFRYDSSLGVGKPAAIFNGREGCQDGDLSGAEYGPLGPFTTWRISLLNENNKSEGLLRDKIDKVVMEFHVWAHPLGEDLTQPGGAAPS